MVGRVQHYPLLICPSNIDGSGLFAQSSIPSQTLVYESDDYETTPFAVHGSLQCRINEHFLENFLRWENHSCVPNTALKFVAYTVQLITTRHVLDGEELVCDYRTTEDSIPTPFRCNCGHCNGIIIH